LNEPVFAIRGMCGSLCSEDEPGKLGEKEALLAGAVKPQQRRAA